MDFDASLVHPIFISLNENCFLKLLVVEACAHYLLFFFSFFTLCADDFEQLHKLLLGELEAHGKAVMNEIFLLDSSIVVWVEGLVRFFN